MSRRAPNEGAKSSLKGICQPHKITVVQNLLLISDFPFLNIHGFKGAHNIYVNREVLKPVFFLFTVHFVFTI